VFDLEGKLVRAFGGGNRDRTRLDPHFDNFLQAVRSRKVESLNADIEVGHVSCGLSHLGNISYRLGESLPVGEIQKRLEQAKLKEECLETFGRVRQHLVDNKLDPDSTPFRFGALLKMDDKSETFIGPESYKANPMLTREYRKGFEVPRSAQLA
jgi:hypothetical protein